jgi:hypothetical protein
MPASTVIVLMPYGAISGRSDSVHPSSANFDAAYVLMNSPQTRPTVELMVMTWSVAFADMTASRLARADQARYPRRAPSTQPSA